LTRRAKQAAGFGVCPSCCGGNTLSLDHAISQIIVKRRLWRSDVSIISVVVPYHGRCTRVLDAAQGVYQLDFEYVEHDYLL
jgi:hypothetical protein